MSARKYLTARQLTAIEAFEARGGVVWVKRKSGGAIVVSISGRREIPLRDAIAKLAA